MSISPRVQAFLRENGVPLEVVAHPTAFTAQEEAAAAHVHGDEWAKVVVFFTDQDEPILAVLPATHLVDVGRLRDLSGAKSLRLAEESEIAGLYPQCEPGAMAPFGALYGQRTFADAHLGRSERIVFNAGDHVEAVRMAWRDYQRLARPVTGEFGIRGDRPPERRGTATAPPLHERGGGWH